MSRGEQVPIVDIETVIHRHVWRRMRDQLHFWERPCMKRRYFLDVYWGYLRIEHEEPRFTNDVNRHVNTKDCGNDVSGSVAPGADLIVPKVKPLTLFRTEFTNNTSEPQTYTFRTERHTKSSWSLSVVKGFTVGGSLSLELSLPGGICKATGGLTGQQSWTKTHGETKEEQLTWSVDSQVRQEAGKSTAASLEIKEEEFSTRFALTSVLSLRSGSDKGRPKLPVAVRRRADNSIRTLVTIENLAAVFENINGFEGEPDNSDAWHVVRAHTVGVSKVNYATEQKVLIGNK